MLVLGTLYASTLFFFGVFLSLAILVEVGENCSDFLSLLSFMVYVSGITAVIGYFVTFFPKKFEGRDQSYCLMSVSYLIGLSAYIAWTMSSYSYSGPDLFNPWYSSGMLSAHGQVISFLAPVLLVVMVAVVVMSKPERNTLRRWKHSKPYSAKSG
ncbi:NADH dehydrogenase subunit 6 (mitochondrion) [Saccostrea cucullata]|uniref:NADH dehydrogenase subunit 6 n=1 Tax=Saccostrea cuccullata TaxID=36930 RepID=A0A0U1ZXJ7_9BIVA|nr:NADH dehydrogenase subunit 6 [Saccostrea cucullata]AKE32250.1 NADH dehydrogenase subunit 6 [Saccostrea cucullata]